MFRLGVLLVVVGIALGASILKYPSGRIIGGWTTNIQEHPYQVSVQYNNTHFCGGILVASNWVLTAAHCITFFHDTNLTIRAGSATHASGGQVLAVSRIVVHANWNSTRNRDNDIAALQLTAPVTITTASTATLPAATDTIPDWATIIVTGWGSIKAGSTSPNTDTLQEAMFPIVNRTQCAILYNGTKGVTTNMFCAGNQGQSTSGSCYQDAGGPAVYNNVVVGMYSWGYECVLFNFAGVYLQISQYRDWIRTQCGV